MADYVVNKTSTKKKNTSQHCCVPLCTSDSRYDSTLHFHQIPQKDVEVRKQWIINIRRDEGPYFKITNSTVVCSNHFLPSDYKCTPVRKTLKKGAVPTVFDWTSKKDPRRVLKRKHLAPRDAGTGSIISKAVKETQEYEFRAEVYEEQPSTCTSASIISDQEQPFTCTSASIISDQEQPSTCTRAPLISYQEQSSTFTSASLISDQEQPSKCTSASLISDEEQPCTCASASLISDQEQPSTCTSASLISDQEQPSTYTSASLISDQEQPHTCTSASLISDHEQRISDLEEKLKEKEEECDRYRQQLEIERFGRQRFSTDNSLVSFYTGFHSFQLCETCSIKYAQAVKL